MLSNGVYFNLPEKAYLDEPRLSASGIKNMLISPANFWASSWLNPRRRDDLEEDPSWAIFGRAKHKRICEGKGAFDAAYAAEILPEDVPGALVKNDELKAECKRLGIPVSGNKDDLLARLRQFGLQTLWPDIEAAYRDTHRNKTLIPKSWLFDIEVAAACVEHDETIRKCFQAGYPEVAVLWDGEVERADGSGEIVTVPMKAKMDYLKPRAIVDVKTYGNPQGKGIKRAITYEIAARRYAVQASVYYDAFDMAQRLIKDGKYSGDVDKSWLEQFTAAEDPQFVFVFIQKGQAPVVTGWIMPRHLGLMSVAAVDVRDSQAKFYECMARFGSDPWLMSSPLEIIGDGDIPLWGSE